MRTALCALALLAAPAAAAPPMLSWGKAGVTLDRYRADAIDCGRQGALHDISDTAPAKMVIAAHEWNDRNLNMSMAGAGMEPHEQQARMNLRFRPGRRLAEVQDIMVSETERCLFDRGYTPFRLTRAQDRRLRRLRLGTPARHAYLHALAADPAILSAQATMPGKD